MFVFVVLIAFFTSYNKGVDAQAVSGTSPTGQNYLCLPAGTPCPTNTGGTIDPRIVTPGGGGTPGGNPGGNPGGAPLCPNGFLPCFAINLPCGTRYVTNPSTADGPATPGAYPWQAYLTNNTGYAGSGVLLDPYHVLTAAHKVYLSQGTPTAVRVYMGVSNPNNLVTNVQSSTVRTITVNPQFNASTLKNDIAVLTLTQPIVLGIYPNINTICVANTGAATSYVGQSCLVSGWGQTAFSTPDAPTNPQKQVTVNIVSYATCRASYANPTQLGTNVDLYLDQAGEICAGGQPMRDACSQDGGSPLVCPQPTGTFTLAGLVIWGKNCGQANVFGVYVNAPFYFNTFIQGAVASNPGTG